MWLIKGRAPNPEDPIMTTWLTSNVKYEYISRVSWSDAAAAKTLSWHYLQGILTLILQYYIRILASVACVVLCLEFLWNMEIGTMINQKYICRMCFRCVAAAGRELRISPSKINLSNLFWLKSDTSKTCPTSRKQVLFCYFLARKYQEANCRQFFTLVSSPFDK